jgi:hypothetical protein
MTTTEKTVSDGRSEATTLTPVIINLGKHKRKRVRRLRKGRGRLVGDVYDAIDDLRAAGEIGENDRPIVMIVRQKRKKRKYPFFF